jgi:hypothetical protein
VGLQVSPDDFADSFRLLQQEGALFRACLRSGFSSLKHANPGDKGAYYSAFFQLSIGVERMMKLVFIVRHMAEHDLATPASSELRNLGHDLSVIYRSLGLDSSDPSSKQESSVYSQILDFLTDFAKSTRYHNLDTLANGKPTRDPLVEYNSIFVRIVSEDLDRRVLQRLSSQAYGLAAALDNTVGVIGRGLDGRLISLPNAFMLGPLHEAGTPLVIWRIYELLAPVRDALDLATDQAHQTNWRVLGGKAAVPFMNDFQDFLWNDREGVLEQTEWP